MTNEETHVNPPNCVLTLRLAEINGAKTLNGGSVC